MHKKIDELDTKILNYIQDHADATATEIGEVVGLSQSPCWRRIKNLEELGIIRKRATLLDREKLGLGIQVFAEVKLETNQSDVIDNFRSAVRKIPHILECYVVMGNVDFILRVVARDIRDYERIFFETLSLLPGVREVNSMITVSTVKETNRLPLE